MRISSVLTRGRISFSMRYADRSFYFVLPALTLLALASTDYDHRLFSATATNSISPLRDGTTVLDFNANPYLIIDSVELNGQRAQFTRAAEVVSVVCPPTHAGDKDTVVFRYHGKKSDAPNG